MRDRGFRQRGFTLIEVLAALAIAATGLLAVARTINSSVEVADATAARTVAYWVASNHMAALRLSATWPASGVNEREIQMGGRPWRVERNVESTPDPDVVKVSIRVFEANRDRPAVARLNGYLARLEPPQPAPGSGPPNDGGSQG